MYMCMYVFDSNWFIRIDDVTHSRGDLAHIFANICTYICVYTCIHVCMYLCIYMRIYKYTTRKALFRIHTALFKTHTALFKIQKAPRSLGYTELFFLNALGSRCRARDCYTLQHTATHCSILQHTATHCGILWGGYE